jgi:hypothetical protein
MHIEEYEDIVVGTKSMPIEDWKRTVVLSWMVQLYYSFKLTVSSPEEIIKFCSREIIAETGIIKHFGIMKYFKKKADDLLEGKGRCDLINGIYFEPEEIVYLNCFCKSGVDPVARVIHARKNNFKKGTENENGYLHPLASQAGETSKMS